MSAGAGRSLGRDYYFPGAVDALRPGFTGEVRDSDQFNVGTLQGRMWFKSLSAQWYLNSRVKSLPNGVAGTKLNTNETKYRDTRGFLELMLTPRISDKLSSMTRASVDLYNFHDNLKYYPGDNHDVFGTEDFLDVWLLAEQRIEISPVPSLKFTAGAEGRLHFLGGHRGWDTVCGPAGTCEEFIYLPRGVTDAKVGDYEEHPSHVLGAYALVDITPSERLRISGGMRLDYYSLYGGVVPSPRLALIVKPYEGGNLKIFGGRAYRAPTVEELYYSYNDIWVPGKDWSKMSAENVYSGEVEFTHRFSTTVSLVGAGYLNYFDNLIAQQGGGVSENPTRFENTGVPILVLGGEAELRREWRQGWMASASYSYARARYLEKDGHNDLRQVPNSPEHMGSLRGAMPLMGSALTLASRLTVEAPRWDRNFKEDSGVDQEETDPAVIWDVVLSGQLDLGGLRYNIGVYNVADWRWAVPIAPQYSVSTQFPQNGRTFLASINLNL
jgi:hypothetical protein